MKVKIKTPDRKADIQRWFLIIFTTTYNFEAFLTTCMQSISEHKRGGQRGVLGSWTKKWGEGTTQC